MANLVPVVYLAFANSLDDHLATLKNESREIFKALQGLEKENKIRVHREESSQIDELHQDLLAYDQEIVIFHYGGHADGSMLQLEGGRGNAGGLAKMLGQQKSLKLVFLNGCATKDQVQLLHRAGVPAVIATSVKINDTKATIFSTAFYEFLAKGNSIEDAFNSASNLLETKYSTEDLFDISFNRFPAWDDDEEPDQDHYSEPGLEWALYTRTEAQTDIDLWRLTSAQSQWQVQLRDAQGVIRSAIDDEPLTITHRSVQRNLSAGVCVSCGTTLLRAMKGKRTSTTCPVCLSDKLEKGAAATSLPDQLLDFKITEKQARSVATEAFEALLTKGKKSDELMVATPVAVWAPYWKFNASVVAKFEGESAFPTGIADGKAKLDWRSNSGHFDTSIDSLLVSASRAPVAQVSIDEPDFKTVREYSSEDSAQLSLPTDKTIEDAFMEASSNVSGYLNAEIKERLGGLDQRNVQSKIRYDNLDAKLVWLPRWLVSAKFQDTTSALVIDGQTGSVDLPRIKGVPQINDEVKNMMGRKTFSVGSDISKANLWASIFGGVGIGIMVGLLMGLAGPSEKSTVGIFIGAVGIALAALLGLNDRHFSVAKGLRIGSFGLAVSIASLSGLYLRANNVLSPNGTPTVLYEKNPLAKQSSNHSSLSPTQETVLFADEVNLEACSELQNQYESELPASVLINNFKIGPMQGTGWDTFAKAVEDDIDEPFQKAALLTVRDAMCGSGQFAKPASIPGAACTPLNSAINNDDYGLISEGFERYELTTVLNQLESEMDEKNAITTVGFLVGMICAKNRPFK